MLWSSSKLLAAGSLLLALSACTNDSTPAATPENRVTFNDFEAVDGWGPALPVTTEKAHSGRFSVKVDKGAEFSLGYANFLNKASASRINKLTVTAWALRAGLESKPSIIVTVVDPANPGAPLFYEALDVHAQVKTYNTWTKVTQEFTLPATVQPTHMLKVYMWQPSAPQATYLDDVEITKS